MQLLRISHFFLCIQNINTSFSSEKKVSSVPVLLASDLKLGPQSSDEQLFDTASFPLAAFHYSERVYQATSNQVIDFHFNHLTSKCLLIVVANFNPIVYQAKLFKNRCAMPCRFYVLPQSGVSLAFESLVLVVVTDSCKVHEQCLVIFQHYFGSHLGDYLS